ncbi:MAG: hypothetical protein ChlgKO_04890 [Chlamydiales bacterium]
MKKIATLLLFLLIGSSVNLCSDETSASEFAKDSFLYGSLGVLAPSYLQPVFGLGLRGQSGHSGFDTAVEGIYISKDAYQLSLSLDYLFYNKPCLKHQFYFGLGLQASLTYNKFYYKHKYPDSEVSFSTECEIVTPSLHPEFIFGKQYISDTGGRRFFEVKIHPVTITERNALLMNLRDPQLEYTFQPSLEVRYGVGF